LAVALPSPAHPVVLAALDVEHGLPRARGTPVFLLKRSFRL
jgi:hypothetical protein